MPSLRPAQDHLRRAIGVLRMAECIRLLVDFFNKTGPSLHFSPPTTDSRSRADISGSAPIRPSSERQHNSLMIATPPDANVLAGFRSRAIGCPCVHQLTPLVEQIAAPVGLLDERAAAPVSYLMTTTTVRKRLILTAGREQCQTRFGDAASGACRQPCVHDVARDRDEDRRLGD